MTLLLTLHRPFIKVAWSTRTGASQQQKANRSDEKRIKEQEYLQMKLRHLNDIHEQEMAFLEQKMANLQELHDLAMKNEKLREELYKKKMAASECQSAFNDVTMVKMDVLAD